MDQDRRFSSLRRRFESDPRRDLSHIKEASICHKVPHETTPDSSCFGEVTKGRSTEADSRSKQKSTELNEVISNGEELNETTSSSEFESAKHRFLVQTLTSMLKNISFVAIVNNFTPRSRGQHGLVQVRMIGDLVGATFGMTKVAGFGGPIAAGSLFPPKREGLALHLGVRWRGISSSSLHTGRVEELDPTPPTIQLVPSLKGVFLECFSLLSLFSNARVFIGKVTVS
ncbi:hypothetical protein C4D60_Mb08t12960 [Musa balbisiana]|uniref:Uncharacterized protein n=1 Tax=Musa balbisiana TaxID=52838 RepID=A0A4S8K3C7_MUSBA|nr:hypothetical protein C4D60_Mb08t12960 [Musa balbisiana]